jgi:hypothetical protein
MAPISPHSWKRLRRYPTATLVGVLLPPPLRPAAVATVTMSKPSSRLRRVGRSCSIQPARYAALCHLAASDMGAVDGAASATAPPAPVSLHHSLRRIQRCLIRSDPTGCRRLNTIRTPTSGTLSQVRRHGCAPAPVERAHLAQQMGSNRILVSAVRLCRRRRRRPARRRRQQHSVARLL